MRLFNTVALEITAQCNRRCKFCPVAYNTRPTERMEASMLAKGLDELGKLEYNGRIEFYIYNEPAMDKPWLLASLRMARELAPKSCLMIATNGDYFKGSDDIVELLNAGLNQLLINCYSKGLYEKRQRWLSGLPVRSDLGVYDRLSPRAKVVQMLDKSNPKEFGSGVFSLTNRAGNIEPFLPSLQEPVQRMCVRPFRLLNINWRGDALVCCQDYHGHVAYGNLASSTLVQLWNHPVMNLYRNKLLQKDRSLPLCRNCDCHSGAYPANVPVPDGPMATAKQVEGIYAQGCASS